MVIYSNRHLKQNNQQRDRKTPNQEPAESKETMETHLHCECSLGKVGAMRLNQHVLLVGIWIMIYSTAHETTSNVM